MMPCSCAANAWRIPREASMATTFRSLRWNFSCVAFMTLGAVQNPADIPVGLKLALVDVVVGYTLAKFHC
jgi:hypothetical protein